MYIFSNSHYSITCFAASPQEISQVLTKEFPQAMPEIISQVALQTQNVSIARWLLKNVALISGVQEIPNALTNLKLFDQNKAKLKANGELPPSKDGSFLIHRT